MAKKTTNTLPSGAPDDGNEGVRAAAGAAADADPKAGVSPEPGELIARIDAAEQRTAEAEDRAARAENRARAVEETLNKMSVSAGSPAAGVVSAEIKKRESIHSANRMLRLEAKAGLKSRMGKKPEEMKLVIFRAPWKRGIYQPDGKAYAFSPQLASQLVAGGVAHYPASKQIEEIHQARLDHQAESVARLHAFVD